MQARETHQVNGSINESMRSEVGKRGETGLTVAATVHLASERHVRAVLEYNTVPSPHPSPQPKKKQIIIHDV